jgi:hypothetical protein
LCELCVDCLFLFEEVVCHLLIYGVGQVGSLYVLLVHFLCLLVLVACYVT